MMDAVSWLLLAFLLPLMLRVVREDSATRKIRNHLVVAGAKTLLAALALHYAAAAFGVGNPVFGHGLFYLRFAQHLLLSVMAGLLLWYAEIWPAGDAKFFMVLSASVPLLVPEIRNFPSYLYLNLLVNIFVMASVYTVSEFLVPQQGRPSGLGLLAALLRDARAAAFSGFSAARVPRLALSFFSVAFLFLLQQALMLDARSGAGRFLLKPEAIFFFVFVLWEKIGALLSGGIWRYITPACYAAYLAAGYFMFREHMLAVFYAAGANVLKFSMLFMVGRFLLSFMLDKRDAVYVGPGDLAPGMVLSPLERRRLRQDTEIGVEFEDNFRDGLTPEQVELLRSWLGKLNVPDPRLEMVKGRPFALWIAAGTAAYLAVGKNLVVLLK